jgi:hypothetical protein
MKSRSHNFDLKILRDERTPNMLNPIAASVAREPFAWPGGYERFAITDNGACLCHKCCKAEYAQIAASYPGDGWHVIGASHDGECDSLTVCDHCSAVIVEDWQD